MSGSAYFVVILLFLICIMKSFRSCLIVAALLASNIFAVSTVTAQITTDSLINHSLDYVDYPLYVRHGCRQR